MTSLCFLHGFAAGGTVWGPYRADFPDALMPTLRFATDGAPVLPGLDEPSILVGWSLGGMVAVEMAARHPEKVKGLVLVSSAPSFVASDLFPEGKPPSALREMRDGIAHGDARPLQGFQKQLFTTAEIRDGWLNRFRREIGPTLNTVRTEDTATASGRGDRSVPLSRGNEGVCRKTLPCPPLTGREIDPATLLSQLAFLERWHAPRELPAVPVAILHGTADAVVDVAAVTAWRRIFPQADAHTAEAGHAIPFVHRPLLLSTLTTMRTAHGA